MCLYHAYIVIFKSRTVQLKMICLFLYTQKFYQNAAERTGLVRFFSWACAAIPLGQRRHQD